MANAVETDPQPGVTKLVEGIANDALHLVTQQLAVFRSEVQEDLRRTSAAACRLITGLATGVTGGILLSLMLVHLLAWAAPALPLWICHGIVGVPLAVLGGALSVAGVHRFRSLNPAVGESAQTFKENVRWLMKLR